MALSKRRQPPTLDGYKKSYTLRLSCRIASPVLLISQAWSRKQLQSPESHIYLVLLDQHGTFDLLCSTGNVKETEVISSYHFV